jgi:hypothetical protein
LPIEVERSPRGEIFASRGRLETGGSKSNFPEDTIFQNPADGCTPSIIALAPSTSPSFNKSTNRLAVRSGHVHHHQPAATRIGNNRSVRSRKRKKRRFLVVEPFMVVDELADVVVKVAVAVVSARRFNL